MKKLPLQLILVIIIVAAGLATNYYFLTPKIAYVESSKVIDSFTEAIKARQKLEADVEQWEKELKMIEDSLNTATTELKNGYEKGSNEKKKELAENLDKWNRDYARYSRSVEQKKVAREQELMQPVIDKINKFMEIWGAQHGYRFVFGTMAGGNIVMADRKYDVTTKVIQDLNEHYKK